MSLTNINRDPFWIKDIRDSVVTPWSTEGTGKMNSDGNVNDRIGYVRSSGASVISATQQGVGTYMRPPTNDYTPYRVKVYVPNSTGIFLVIGYAPATITGIDDIVSNQNLYNIRENLDEIIMLPPHEDGHPFKDRPICFGVAAYQSGISNVRMSVQNLSVAPPPIALGVS